MQVLHRPLGRARIPRRPDPGHNRDTDRKPVPLTVHPPMDFATDVAKKRRHRIVFSMRL